MSSPRIELLQALNVQVRIMTTNSVMFSQIVAEKIGIHPTDNECLDILLLKGPSTAGQLAKQMGLTTGAVTAMLDRLEKADYVRREHDKEDRRRVIVYPNDARIYADIMPYMLQMATAMEEFSKDFTDDELATILRFTEKANQSATQVIAHVQEQK
jgi:DNA-binding MarR family transcriptional regulator